MKLICILQESTLKYFGLHLLCSTFSHLHHLYLLVAAVPRNEPAVFTPRHQCAVPQHTQSKDAALVSSLDDVADAISACVTEMGGDG